MSNEAKFETGKWYYFKDEMSEEAFRGRISNNNGIADTIVEGEGFCPTKVTAGYVINVNLAYGNNKDIIIYPSDRKFFKEMVEVTCDEDLAEDAAPSEPGDFPLTKITISNNSEAWTVYQMLKAHFKE